MTIPAVTTAPIARAEDAVTYEVRSDDIYSASVTYNDVDGQHTLQNVALPWRVTVPVAKASSSDTSLRADWQPEAEAFSRVTVRVYYRGSLLCEVTVDSGDAECFGSGQYYVPHPPYNFCPPPVLSCGGTYRP